MFFYAILFLFICRSYYQQGILFLVADNIAWKLLKMALEVEYMMEYQYPDLLVTEDCWLQRKSADYTVMDRRKTVVSYKPMPAEM